MKRHVRKWLDWYKKIQHGIDDVYVEIKGISIGSEWGKSWYWYSPNIRVLIQIGKIKKQTNELPQVTSGIMHDGDGYLKESLPQKLGPFTWKYGSDDIVIRIDNTSKNDSVSKSYNAQSEWYNIDIFKKTIEIKNGYKIPTFRTEHLNEKE